MDTDLAPFSEPVASTSRAVFTLPYIADDDEIDGTDGFSDAASLERYEQAWTECSKQIQTTLSSLHDASLDQIVNFVHTSRATSNSLYSVLAGREPLRTGLIVGASPGSSSLLYSSLIRLLSSSSTVEEADRQTPTLVSRVSSRDCSNIKNALRSLIGGFVGGVASVELDEGEEDDDMDLAAGPASLKSAMLVPEDMRNLKAWYEHRYGKQDTTSAPSLVVLLEDLEAMDGKVLTQMIETLSLYTSTLPLVLLVGIATTADALYNLVPRKVCNKLDAQSFFVDPGVGAFNALVRGVLIDGQAPLQLGSKAYTDMWRVFEDLHHSIDATISYIQYLYMNHFATQAFSALTFPPPSAASDLTADLQNNLRCLPSLASSTSPLAATLADPATAPSEVLAALSSAQQEKDDWHAARSEAFEALLACMEFWENRKPTEGVLGLVLGEGAGVGKVIDEVAGLVLQASSTKLPSFLRLLLSRLSLFQTTHPTSSTSLQTFVTTQLNTLQPILDAPRPAGRSNLVNQNLAGQLALPGFAAAQAGKAGVTQLDRDFSNVARETSEGLRDTLKTALKPCTALLLHELWFANDSSAAKRFNPSPLPTLLRTLQKADPYSDPTYAPPSPSPAEVEPIPLDLAVAYRCYAESHPSGRLANLGEWWAAFELQAAEEPEEAEVRIEGANGKGKGKGREKARGRKRARDEEDGEDNEDEEESEEEEEEDDEGPSRRKQARFLRAVGDLAHLGFIHPTTYKPEHVLKSVY
ncbi:hypothetical protein JCM11641_008456 [Rhodosporidiobolus odoratus]